MSNDLSDSLTLDLDIEDFTLTGLSKLEINPEDYRNFEDYIDKTLKEGISRFIAEISNGLIEELQKQAPAFLKVQHEDISQFDGKVYDYWGSALDLLELVLAMTLEVGANFNKTYSQDAIKHNDYVFEALMRLHARGCQVGQEILTLLKHGFPDGAHARWRT